LSVGFAGGVSPGRRHPSYAASTCCRFGTLTLRVHGYLQASHNLSELELRREKVGAHNWLYCGSDDGAHWNATAVSLVASCQLHGIEPWAYLRDVLTLLPCWPAKNVLALSPKYWNETRQQPETQQRLAALRLLGRDDASHDADTTPPA
jgi:hypothetical protein